MTVPMSQLHGRPIMDLATATTIGEIEDVVLDPTTGRVAAFTVARSSDGRTILAWESVRSVGPDAVTVEGAGALRQPTGTYESGVADGTYRAVGKPVLTEGGDAEGTVDDVVLDVDSGTFVALVIDGTDLAASQVMGIGDHAVVITAP